MSAIKKEVITKTIYPDENNKSDTYAELEVTKFVPTVEGREAKVSVDITIRFDNQMVTCDIDTFDQLVGLVENIRYLRSELSI